MAERRTRKVVDRFQYKLVARMIGYWFVYQLTLWNFLFCWRLLAEGRGNPLEQYGRFFAEFYPMIFVFLILVPVFAWDAVKFYHRVAGPVFRFRQVAREIAAGKPVHRVKLRDGDELGEMQDDFNAMLDTLQRQGAIELVERAESGKNQESQPQVRLVACDTDTGDHKHAAG